MPPAPVTLLAYDDLPPGSDIAREVSLDPPSLRVTVAAGEPPADAIKQAALQAAASGAMWSTPLLLLAMLSFRFGLVVNRISGPALLWAWAFFALFCLAMVLLVAWIRFGVITDALRAGRRQITAIAATRGRLLIETSGPFGLASHDLPAESILRLRPAHGPLRDDRDIPRRLWHLALTLRDEKTILLLPGRDVRELKWTAGMIERTMGLAEVHA